MITFASILVLASLAAALVYDLCGCYTLQLEALPQASTDIVFGQPARPDSSSSQLWTSGLYAANAEQFTHFGTRIDGREVTEMSLIDIWKARSCSSSSLRLDQPLRASVECPAYPTFLRAGGIRGHIFAFRF